MRCFGAVKSPFPAAIASDAASNSFRCTNLPRQSRKRSRPFLRRQNTKNRSLRNDPSDQSTRLSMAIDYFRNLRLIVELDFPGPPRLLSSSLRENSGSVSGHRFSDAGRSSACRDGACPVSGDAASRVSTGNQMPLQGWASAGCYAFPVVIVSSPCPCGPVSRIRNRMAKVSPTKPRIEKIHMPSPYPPGLSSPAWA